MEEIIDLDILSPQIKKVKINDTVIDVYPIRVNDLIKIQSLDKNNIVDVVKFLKDIIPKIEEVNPTMEQLTKLMSFLTNSNVDTSDKKKE